ncbi:MULTISPECIES: hypothetical protein [unclassified Streptococcus]|uniref:hypothetical protein n=1 Tax=unclassified Streptococcus TaxID=2608887 RepID=UPI0001F890A6|nr:MULTISPECIES: hypothetical protein [unclassified Streptococcus]EFX55602.1 putative ATP synthase F1, delta subunit [Streptococcus sp. C150]MBS7137546.1 hypothetical protein [Streptococcus sp.]
MNQKEWVEYFEAVNGRKPSMQEFQVAREKGEFVFNKLNTPAPATVAPQPQVQLTNPAGYSQTVPRQNGSKFSFNKKITIGLSIAGLVAVIGLVWFFFFPAEPSLDGVWVCSTDQVPVVYNLNGKKKSVYDYYTIKKIIKRNEAKKELNEKLSSFSSNLKTLVDVDKRFHLKTREVVIFKTDDNTYYNLLQSNGTNVILDKFNFDKDDFSNLDNQTNSEFRKYNVYINVKMPKVMVGKWKFDDMDNIFQISDHGIIKRVEDGKNASDTAGFYNLEDLKRINEKNKDNDDSESKIKNQFEHVQKAIKKQGYTVNSPKEVYKQPYLSNYTVPVNGGKTLIMLDDEYNYIGKGEKVE